MQILAHRGFWRVPAEKNTLDAIRRAFDHGFGIETDLRDRGGDVVISHDPPAGGEPTLAELLLLLDRRPLSLALNIKADGLAQAVVSATRAGHVADWFAFDMSIPDTRSYLALRAPVFMRMSEVERDPPWLERSAGVWLDAFDGPWCGVELIAAQLASHRVCAVSPELHGRAHGDFWRMLAPLAAHPGLSLCTDLPLDARDFFGAPS